MKKALSALLAAVMVLGLLALAPVTASAAPAFEVNTATPTIVTFGGKEWAVIGYDGVGVASQPGKLTLLLANEGYPRSIFNQNTGGCEYSGSRLQTAMDNAYNALPDKEKALVAGRDLAGGSGLYSSPNTTGYDGNKIAGPDVPGAKFWPLSGDEATAVNSEIRKFASWWWLRSPGETRAAAIVTSDGYVGLPGTIVNIQELVVRPACWVNLPVLTVSGGTGGGANLWGTAVAIAAGAPPAGKVFDKWEMTGEGSIADAASASTTFTVGMGNATVRATYKNAPAPVDDTNYIKLWGKTTKYVSDFWNWLLCIVCFGWIWMAF
ncbi:MAG: DUF6273 domain-containing protein [Oscillospiraceae bacterium]|nr:DUF6273 domain-containing protein [Oscillospiraceae bacterium]